MSVDVEKVKRLSESLTKSLHHLESLDRAIRLYLGDVGNPKNGDFIVDPDLRRELQLLRKRLDAEFLLTTQKLNDIFGRKLHD